MFLRLNKAVAPQFSLHVRTVKEIYEKKNTVFLGAPHPDLRCKIYEEMKLLNREVQIVSWSYMRCQFYPVSRKPLKVCKQGRLLFS